MSGAPLAIEVRELHKTFRIPTERVHRLKERVLHPLRGSEYNELHVLDGVSFDVVRGEFFGIVGVNGSGKSTLLKLLASIYRADGGSIRVAGNVTPFIELGVGFHPELTAHDNVLINAVMMGLTPREASQRFDSVMDYAGLGEFSELQLKNYSSGMHVRLAFAVMLEIPSDVLLIDEVLAVGDAAFQEKCIDSLMRLHSEGRTIVFVTHAMPLVERFCDRAMLLHRGKVERIGEPIGVTRGYLDTGRTQTAGLWAQSEPPPPSDREMAASITSMRLQDGSGRDRVSVECGESLTISLELEIRAMIERAWVHLEIKDRSGTLIFGTGTTWFEDGAAVDPGDRLKIRWNMEMRLVPGPYVVVCTLKSNTPDGTEVLEVSSPISTQLTVTGHVWGIEGLATMPHRFEVERDRSRAVAR